jgi:hypothetical protein
MKKQVLHVRGLLCLIFVPLLLAIVSPVRSQSILFGESKFEVGIHLGPTNFLGDLGGNRGIGTTFLKDLNIPLTRAMAGVFFTAYPREWIGFRIAGNYGSIEGYDSIIRDRGGDEKDRLERNLGFRSRIAEAYAAIELYPTVLFERFDGLDRKIRPYGLVGLGVFHFNPRANYNGTMVDLKPLRLEGQGFPEYPDRPEYKLTQMNVLLGIGFKYFISERTFVGLEALHRKTFTDYIDDVSTNYIDPRLFDKYLSPANAKVARAMAFREPLVTGNSRPYINLQRGNPKQNDSYLSLSLKLGVRLNGQNSPNSRARNQMRCPARW